MNPQIITIKELEEQFPPVFHYVQKFYTTDIKNDPSIAFRSEIDKNILDIQYYDQVWKNGFCRNLSKLLSKEIIDCGGLGPSWAGYLKFEGNGDSTQEPLIYFYYSFLTRYYFFMAVEEFVFLENGVFLPSRLTVSPYGKYEKTFTIIESFFKEYFDNAQFLPYIFDSILVNGLKIHYQDKIHGSIHDGFFNKFELSGLRIDNIHGDVHYNISAFK